VPERPGQAAGLALLDSVVVLLLEEPPSLLLVVAAGLEVLDEVDDVDESERLSVR
jgi:hypothetical protein